MCLSMRHAENRPNRQDHGMFLVWAMLTNYEQVECQPGSGRGETKRKGTMEQPRRVETQSVRRSVGLEYKPSLTPDHLVGTKVCQSIPWRAFQKGQRSEY